ncbi:MAG: hypothetical protein AAF596_09160, partial [Planctomycetota bacterium]
SPHTSFVVDLEVNRPGSGRLVARPKPTLSLPPGTPDPPIAPQQAATTVEPATASAPEGADAPEAETASLFGLTPGKRPPGRWPE